MFWKTNPSSNAKLDSESTDSADSNPHSGPLEAPHHLRNFFSDAKRKVDYVIVYKHSTIQDEEAVTKLRRFVNTLADKGIEFEIGPFLAYNNVTFLLAHGPDDILEELASAYHFDLAKDNPNNFSESCSKCRFLNTEISDYTDEHLFKRSPLTLSGVRPDGMTNAERSAVLYMFMNEVWFGEEESDCGLRQLLNQNVVESAYPLHDGKWEWNEEGPLCDRQLLVKYWASFRVWYKIQPLNLIERYFGPETAFYFAWLGFYNKLLIPISIIGILFFFSGFFYTNDDIRISEICHSDLLLCPHCPEYKRCNTTLLKNFCLFTKISHVFDSPSGVLFAMMMSLWATFFVALWKRNQSILLYKWNLSTVIIDRTPRYEYYLHANTVKVVAETGDADVRISTPKVIVRYIVSASVFILTALLVIVVLLVIIIVRILIRRGALGKIIPTNKFVASFLGSLLQVISIYIMSLFYQKVAETITNFECHKTTTGHHNSLIYKCFALNLINNFAGISYLAFFRGKFYTYPGDESQYFFGISTDECDPPGCMFDLSLLLGMQLCVRIITTNVFALLVDCIKHKCAKMKNRNKNIDVTARWEEDYGLSPESCFWLIEEFNDAVVHYGLVLFFVAALPLAPFLALIFNTLKLRADAIKVTRIKRRPVARKVAGITPWTRILKGITFTSVLTNVVIIAFTSDIVSRILHLIHVESDLSGYVQSTLSTFYVVPHLEDARNDSSVTAYLCYYYGRRYSPFHEQAFELTQDHWYNVVVKFVFVGLFEHFIIVLNAFISYTVPEVPEDIKANVQDNFARRERIRILNRNFVPKSRINLVE